MLTVYNSSQHRHAAISKRQGTPAPDIAILDQAQLYCCAISTRDYSLQLSKVHLLASLLRAADIHSQSEQHISLAGQSVALHMHLNHLSASLSGHRVLHLHGLQNQQGVPFLHLQFRSSFALLRLPPSISSATDPAPTPKAKNLAW